MSEELKKREQQKDSFLLVVDDVQRDMNFVRKSLRTQHYRNILTFQNPWDAVELLETGVGDILILNFENQNMNSLDAVQLIKKNKIKSNIPVLLTSFDCTPKNVIAARKAGADGVIVKPLSVTGLLSQLERSATFLTDQLLLKLNKELTAMQAKGFDLHTEQKEKNELLKPFCISLYYTVFGFPWFVRGYMELSKLFFEMNLDNKAVGLLKKAATISPKDPAPPDALANYYAEKESYEKSLLYAKKYADIVQNANGFGKLAEQQLRCGKLDEGILTINLALSMKESKKNMKVSPEELSANLTVRGLIHKERATEKNDNNILEMAAEDFSKALKLTPSLISAQYNLMITYKKMGNTKKAIEVLDTLKAMEPTDSEGWLLMAEAFFHEKDLHKTYFAIQKALSLKKNNVRFSTRVSELLFKYNILDKARDLLFDLIKADPSNGILYNRLGLIYRRNGNVPEALKWYKEGVARDPKNAAIWFNIAKACFEEGNLKAGNQALRKCRELEPDLDVSWQSTFEDHIPSTPDK
ncbi:MAG: tetratricopeptide repeat protein [Nitrospinota bacterium]